MRYPLLLLIILLSSCRKDPPLFINKCLNGIPGENTVMPIEMTTRYRNLVFSDDFESGKSGFCYSQKPICGTRLDWFMGSDCPFDEKDPRYAGLKNLNKCVWNVWHGYNFWNEKMAQLTFKADAVEVTGGRLVLKVLPNPDYQSSLGNCGARNEANPYALNYFNDNCPLISGAVDSKYYNNSNHQGRNALYGRIEIKARYVSTTTRGGYSAFWLWPNNLGQGYPHNPTTNDPHTHLNGNQEPRIISEIDVNESNFAEKHNLLYQTYHNWIKGTEGSSSIAKTADVDMSKDKIYGVEWFPGGKDPITNKDIPAYIQYYYADLNGGTRRDCVTSIIKAGTPSDGGNKGVPLKISEVASFMMLSIGGSGWNKIDLNTRDRFEIDEVRIYE